MDWKKDTFLVYEEEEETQIKVFFSGFRTQTHIQEDVKISRGV